MALRIKATEADKRARSLAKLTGESLTGAVTEALRERLALFAERLQADYDTSPVTSEEWNAAAGDDA